MVSCFVAKKSVNCKTTALEPQNKPEDMFTKWFQHVMQINI